MSACHQVKFRKESALFLIIQIALGIVLAVLVLVSLPQIIGLGLAVLAMVAGLAVVVGLAVWLPNAFVFGVGAAVIAYSVWTAIQHAKRDNHKDAQELQLGQCKSATSLTWIESVSKADRNKQASQLIFFGGGFSMMCFIVAHLLGWSGLWGIGFIVLPFAIYLSIYAKQRLTNRCYATTPKKVLFRVANIPTPEATKEGQKRGW